MAHSNVARAGYARASGRATVADAMVHAPKLGGPGTTVAHVHELFHDHHVHAALIVDRGDLLSVVERHDIDSTSPDLPARTAGQLRGRVVGPDADLDATWRAMTAHGRRRLAVVDDRHTLLGLLCLKRTGAGFCSDTDVQARAAERHAGTSPARDHRRTIPVILSGTTDWVPGWDG